MWKAFCQKTKTCQVPSCDFDLTRSGAKASEMHLKSHFRMGSRSRICRWAGCRVSAGKQSGLLQHLSDAHGIPFVTDIMNVAQFCHECSEIFTDESVWEDHCNDHLLDIDIFCGQVVKKGVVLFARKCVFCLGNTALCAAQRYRGYTNSTKFFEHLENHLDQVAQWPFQCPHPSCAHDAITPMAFSQHLQHTHGISRYRSSSGEVSTVTTNAQRTSDSRAQDLGPVNMELVSTGLSLTSGQHDHTSVETPQTLPGDFQLRPLHASCISNAVVDNSDSPLANLPEASPLQQSFPDFESISPDHLASQRATTGSLHGFCESSSSEQNSSEATRSPVLHATNLDYAAIDPLPMPSGTVHRQQAGQLVSPSYNGNEPSITELGDRQAPSTRCQSHVAPILPDTPQTQLPDPTSGKSCQSLRPMTMVPKFGRPCPVPGCDEVFRLMRELTYHTIEAHKQSPYTCETCGKLFRDGSRLRDHETLHRGPPKRLTCNIDGCQVDFGRSDTLRRHQRKKHAGKGA